MDEKIIKERMERFMNLRLHKTGTINAMMDMRLIHYDIQAKRVVLAFPVEAWQSNPNNHMHGGMICTALDITMGCVSYVFSEAEFTPTIQMSVNFVKGIQEGEVLEIEGILDHAGSRMAQTRAIARVKGKGGVVASSNGSYAINHRQ